MCAQCSRRFLFFFKVSNDVQICRVQVKLKVCGLVTSCRVDNIKGPCYRSLLSRFRKVIVQRMQYHEQ